MKPAPFDLVVAESWDEALDAVSEMGEDAQVLAGGQSLVAMLNMRLAKPSVLVDIGRIPGADIIEIDRGTVRIGAQVRQRSLERHSDTPTNLPLLAEALPHVGHVQTRSRGTVCGSLCHADPSAELPLCLVALEGDVELVSNRGKRTLSAEKFFTGLLSTARSPDEIVRAARYPMAKKEHGYAFSEISERHGDYALVNCAAIAGSNFIRLAVGAVADRPIARTWQTTDLLDIEAELNDFAWDLNATDNHHASARYQRDAVRTLGVSTIKKSIARFIEKQRGQCQSKPA